jgi:hypothetical protein
MRFFLILTLIGASIVSCVTPEKYRQVGHRPFTQTNLSTVNGIFKYEQTDELCLMGIRKNRIKEATYSVRLTAVNESRIIAELFMNDQIIETRTLKGTIRDTGYFSIRRHTKFIPIPLFMLYSTTKSELILTNSGDLQIASVHNSFGWFLFLIAGEPRGSGNTYARLSPATKN